MKFYYSNVLQNIGIVKLKKSGVIPDFLSHHYFFSSLGIHEFLQSTSFIILLNQ